MSNPIKTVLYAVDLGRQSKPALSMAVSVAKQHNAKLLLLYVVEPISPATAESISFYLSNETVAEMRKKSIEEVYDNINEKIEELYKEEVKKELPDGELQSYVLEGVPAPTILKTAEKMDADLIVMGSHSHGTLDTLFIGSVANKVMNRSNKPVLLVPIKSD